MRFGRARRQPPLQGDRLPLPLHDARDGPAPRRAPAPRADPPRRAQPRQTYRYERELEDFLRYSPSVRPSSRLEAQAKPRNVAPGAPGAAPALDDLEADEIIALLPSLDPAGLKALHEHEVAHRGRRTVIVAIERLQRWEADA